MSDGTTQQVFETERLVLRRATFDDDAFVLELINDPDWIRFISDRGIRTLEGARIYIQETLVAMYDRLGFGLWVAERKEDGAPLGLCGLIKRDGLDDVDVGFGFLATARGQGYAREATEGAIDYARGALGLARLAAITTLDNASSMRLLEALGFRFERMVRLSEEGAALRLFVRDM